ncbi:MAG: hypothetical protein GX804_10635 [Lentisphaerae bacterium]|nr:hypothetical protein [Lentisphaerota bacterium]
MKQILFFNMVLILLLLTGCSKKKEAPEEAPDIDEQEEELVLDDSDEWESQDSATFYYDASEVAVEIDSSYLRQREHFEEQIESLREYSKNADPDDPYALSEERIEALSQNTDLMFL